MSKRWFRPLLALSACLALLTGCAPTADGSPPAATGVTADQTAAVQPAALPAMAADDTVPSADLVIGFVPAQSAGHLDTAMASLAASLEAELGVSVALHTATSSGALRAALVDASVHAAVLSPSAVVAAVDDSRAEPVLVVVRNRASASRGEFYARCDSPYTALEEIKGARFGFVSPNSTLGHHVPHVTLRHAGIEPRRDLSVTFAGAHDDVIRGIYDGDLDAGVTFQDGIETLTGARPDVAEVVCSIGLTLDVPNDGVVVAASLSAAERDAFVAAWLAVLEHAPQREALAVLIGGDGVLVPAPPGIYDVMREVSATFR